MKRKFTCSVIVGMGLLCSHQAEAHQHTHYIVTEEPVAVVEQPVTVVDVEGEPPAIIEEEVTVSPGPSYVWMAGYWKWDKHWKWVKGRWEQRPFDSAVWEPGYWKKKNGHWEWKDGHWK